MESFHSPLDLAYPSHGLSIFNHPDFSSWALLKSPSSRRTHWQCEHHGRLFVIPRSRPFSELKRYSNPSLDPFNDRDVEELIHVLKDPVRKNHLLVVRKSDLSDPFGTYHVYSVFPTGEEHLVAEGHLGLKSGHAFFSDWNVVQAAYKKPGTLAGENQRLLGQLARLDSRIAAEENHDQRIKMLEQMRSLEMKAMDLKAARTPNVKVEIRPDLRQARYRKSGIGRLVIGLVEEIARKAGFSELHAHFDLDTSGKFILRHGWQRVDQDDKKIVAKKQLRY